MKDKTSPIQQEIVIDKKTAEPTIADAKSLPENSQSDNLKLKEIDLSKSIGKQLVMNKLGFVDEEVHTDKRKKIFKRIVSLVFAAFVVGVLIFTAIDDFSSDNLVSWSVISGTFADTWFYILALLATFAIFFLARGVQRSLFCKSITGDWLFGMNLEAGVVCQLYNHLTPFGAGGQPFEIRFVSQNGLHGGHASSVPLSSYVISMFSNVSLSIAAILLFKFDILHWSEEGVSEFIPTTIFIMAIVGVSLNLLMPCLVILFSIFPRFCAGVVSLIVILGSKLKLIKDPKRTKYSILRTLYTNSKCIKSIFKKPWLLLSTYALGLIEQLALASFAYFTLKFFGFDWTDSPHVYEWLQIVVISIVINNAVSFIPTPGSSGAADLSMYGFFTAILQGGFAFPAMITWRLFCFYLMIILGFVMLRIKVARAKRKNNL